MSIKIIDRGWNKIKRSMLKLNRSYTKVGLPEKGKIAFVPGRKILKMSELVIVGAVHEFGAPRAGRNRNINIPERSWLRSTFDENRGELGRFQEFITGKIVDRILTPQQGLAQIGEFMTRKTQEKIEAIKSPPNSPATIKNKTRAGKIGDNPLIDTGQFRQSITHIEVLK